MFDSYFVGMVTDLYIDKFKFMVCIACYDCFQNYFLTKDDPPLLIIQSLVDSLGNPCNSLNVLVLVRVGLWSKVPGLRSWLEYFTTFSVSSCDQNKSRWLTKTFHMLLIIQ